MNIPFEGTLFAMQQPEAAVGQTALRGKPASQMTSRNQKFETLGEAVMDALKDGTAADGLIKTDLVFASEEEVFSFGRYYYRYIYLGKEEVTLYSSDENGEYAVYISCENPDRAVSEHRQVQDRLSDVVKACQTLGDREKAEYFYHWVYENVSYDQTLENRTVYDAVINGSSVCWGYVSTYLMLCRDAGLVCEPVYAGNHAWNRTWIDGEWRYCDITWDKSLGSSSWKFLTQKEMDSDSMHNNL